MTIPLETAVPIINPFDYDVLISDVRDTDYEAIGNEVGYKRYAIFSDSDTPPQTINGVMWGPSLRAFIPLVVSKRGVSVTVLFLFDTGSPSTYLCEDTLSKIGFTENIPRSTKVDLHGTTMDVYKSHGHFANIDLLGQDFMRKSNGFIQLNYQKELVHLSFEKIHSDISTQQSSVLFNEHIEETKLLTMALINNTTSVEHGVQVSHCGGLFSVERIMDGEMFQQWSHYTKEQCFCGQNDLTFYENSLSLVSSTFSETCEIVQCKKGLLWLLLVANDDTVQAVFLRCRNLIPSVNFCVRDMSFSNSNYELLFEIPDNIVLPHVDVSNVPSFLCSNKHVIGYTYGPYFDGAQWTSENALWIFSKYGGFIDYVENECLPEYCHIFEAKREKLANYEATNEQTGLFCGLRMWKNVGYMGESALTMGPSLRLTRNNQTIEGILTTLHSVADDGSQDILTNGDNIYYRMEKSIEKSDSIKIPDRKACIAGQVFTSFDSYKSLSLPSEKCICNDFAIVGRSIENGLKIGIPNKDGNIATETISSIEDISVSTSNSLVRIYKNGHKTGNKRGIFVNNIKMYENMSVPRATEDFDNNGIATINFCSYILIYSCSNDFAEKGDSGSLCYLMNKDTNTKVGVGLLVEKVCDRLFLAIPLVGIAEYFETEGYNVEWVL